MKRATISEAKNHLSALLDRVRSGETVLILDRKVPVARLVPVTSDAGPDPDAAGRLARLERAGLIRRGSMRKVAAVLDEAPPSAAGGGDVLAALLEERRASR